MQFILIYVAKCLWGWMGGSRASLEGGSGNGRRETGPGQQERGGRGGAGLAWLAGEGSRCPVRGWKVSGPALEPEPAARQPPRRGCPRGWDLGPSGSQPTSRAAGRFLGPTSSLPAASDPQCQEACPAGPSPARTHGFFRGGRGAHILSCAVHLTRTKAEGPPSQMRAEPSPASRRPRAPGAHGKGWGLASHKRGNETGRRTRVGA